MRRLRRREPDLSAALRRALAADAARGGTVADLGDLAAGRVPLPPLPSVGEAAPDMDDALDQVNDVVRTPSDVDALIARLYPPRPAREQLPLTWRQRQHDIDICTQIPNGPEVA